MSPSPKGLRHLWGPSDHDDHLIDLYYSLPRSPNDYTCTCKRCGAKRLTKLLPGNNVTSSFYLDGADWKRELKSCKGTR